MTKQLLNTIIRRSELKSKYWLSLLYQERIKSFNTKKRPQDLLQVLSLLNDNALLKVFFKRSIIWLYTIIISLYHCYVITIFIWSLYFNYEKNNHPNKQTKDYVDWHISLVFLGQKVISEALGCLAVK